MLRAGRTLVAPKATLRLPRQRARPALCFRDFSFPQRRHTRGGLAGSRPSRNFRRAHVRPVVLARA